MVALRLAWWHGYRECVVLPSVCIFCHLSRSQDSSLSRELSLPSHLLYLQVFLRQRHNLSSVSGVYSSLVPVGRNRNTSSRSSDQVQVRCLIELNWLILLQRSNSSADLNSHPVFKAEPRHHSEEAHFHRLYLLSLSFGCYLEFMAISDPQVNRQLRFHVQRSPHHDSTGAYTCSFLLCLTYKTWRYSTTSLGQQLAPSLVWTLHPCHVQACVHRSKKPSRNFYSSLL